MKYTPRCLGKEILNAVRHFPAILVTGSRRSGKTTLLRHLFPKATYVLLEDPDIVARVKADPRGFLDTLKEPALLDEIQNAPELFNYIRTRIDMVPEKYGRWLLTGSQEAPLMQGVTESMAGRVAIFQLFPFSSAESAKVSLLRGGFPEVIVKPFSANTWFRSYIQTYLERDVRSVSSVRDLPTFRRFIALLASRCGQMLNKTDLAGPLGVAVPTITEWVNIMEITGQIMIVPPFYENFGKRLVKSPKLYFADSGLACHLLGVRDEKTLRASPFLGPLFEGLVASEIVKNRLNRGLNPGLYYFRDQQGLEVDFLIDNGNRRLTLIEAKATKTPMPDMAKSLNRLANSIRGYDTVSWLVHEVGAEARDFRTMGPRVKAADWRQIDEVLRQEKE